MTVNLLPHQQRAVDRLENGKILCGNPGTGKSRVAIAYFFTKVCKGVPGDWGSLRAPRDIYIITTAKKRDSLDWETEAVKFGIGKERDASIAGLVITVDSWNNIDKYRGIKDAFFVFDEQRLVGSGAWTKSFLKIALHNEWILLSATPGDTWLDYIPVFVANGFYRNRSEFKREHVVYNHYGKFPKVDRYLNTGRLVRHRNNLLVHMPYESHTVRHSKTIEVDYDKTLFDRVVKDRWHVYENRPLRDVAELFAVMRKVVNSDTARLRALEELLHRHPKVIVFYNFDYELEILRSLAKSSMRLDPLKGTIWEKGFDEKTGKMIYPSRNGLREKWEGRSRPDFGRNKSISEQEQRSKWQTKSNGISTQISQCTPETTSSSLRQRGLQTHEPVDTTLSMPREVLPTRLSPALVADKRSSTTLRRRQTETTFISPNSETGHKFELAEWNGHKHEPIPKTDSWVYLVQYQSGAEGWNCIETDAMVFYSLTYSYKLFHQAHGRIDRLNTPFTDLWYYTLASRSFIDLAVQKALKAKKSFNEASFRGFKA